MGVDTPVDLTVCTAVNVKVDVEIDWCLNSHLNGKPSYRAPPSRLPTCTYLPTYLGMYFIVCTLQYC
jgi:hypothetical protein